MKKTNNEKFVNFMKEWKYTIATIIACIVMITCNKINAAADEPSSNNWSESDFEEWVNSTETFQYSGDDELLQSLVGKTNREIYDYFNGQLRSRGNLRADLDKDGNVDAYICGEDFHRLLRIILTPYKPVS